MQHAYKHSFSKTHTQNTTDISLKIQKTSRSATLASNFKITLKRQTHVNTAPVSHVTASTGRRQFGVHQIAKFPPHFQIQHSFQKTERQLDQKQRK